MWTVPKERKSKKKIFKKNPVLIIRYYYILYNIQFCLIAAYNEPVMGKLWANLSIRASQTIELEG